MLKSFMLLSHFKLDTDHQLLNRIHEEFALQRKAVMTGVNFLAVWHPDVL